MNSITHLLASFNLLHLIFQESVSFGEILLFSLIFGVLIDLDILIGIALKRSVHRRRTWIQEPFGLIAVGLPIALILSQFKEHYFFLVFLPYLVHVVLDYITIHEVVPFAPFSKKSVKVGFISSFPRPAWYRGRGGFSELYVLGVLIIITLIQLL